ncbi:MAG: hypothetical protein IJ794_12425 [Lachnospiraceae bacterium]|nr:hypothetical protein [Lachnospiraceae bacterium]
MFAKAFDHGWGAGVVHLVLQTVVNIHYVDLEREKALGRILRRFINLVEPQNLSGQFIENARTQEKGAEEYGRTENDSREHGNEQSADNLALDSGDNRGSGRSGSEGRESNDGRGHKQIDNTGISRNDASVLQRAENRTITLSVGGSPEKIAAEIKNFADAKGTFRVSFENHWNEIVSEFYVVE